MKAKRVWLLVVMMAPVWVGAVIAVVVPEVALVGLAVSLGALSQLILAGSLIAKGLPSSVPVDKAPAASPPAPTAAP